MPTTIRPEISENSPYWIERSRYYELKHFCLQYPIWRKALAALDGYGSRSASLARFSTSRGEVSDPTAREAEARAHFYDRIHMVEQAADRTNASYAPYILKAVTEGISFEHLKARHDLVISKDAYYELYRKFFWLLNSARK